MENFFDLLFIFFLLCRHANKHFDVNFWRIRPVFSVRKMEETRSIKEGMEPEVFICRQSWHLFLKKIL